MNRTGYGLLAIAVALASSASTTAVAQAQEVRGARDAYIARQRAPGSSDVDFERQRALGMRDAGSAGRYGVYVNDPDYAYYRLKKIFEENWTVSVTGPKSNMVDLDEERADRIRIEYVPPKNPEHQALYEMLKERHALEMLQQIFSPLRLPLDVTIKTVGCDGVSNAWYDRQGKQPIISLCYEYLQELCYERLQETMQKMPKEMIAAGFSAHDIVVGQFLYAALHELGHAAFDLYDVPVFGREEDAADLFATYIMLQFRNNQARKFIAGAAYSYMAFVKPEKDKGQVTIPLLAFSSNHGTPEERFYNILCIAYGSDQNMFADLVEKEVLPKSRAAGCKYEFQVLRYAFRNQIMPHLDQQKANEVLEMTWFVEPEARPEVRRAVR
jgi:hypothetical protein